MHICLACGSKLVQPASWVERSAGVWWVELRCPECEHRHSGLFPQRDLDDYDEELDRGMQALVASLRGLTRENMAREAELLAQALRADALLPEDF
jgi:hypothetical protein